ncbi:MAG: arylamine N-acetyltransferase [Acidobacteria bacterium]|nr:arylamine N-acetyltransferase [Acidobacteriota bacterium]
MDTSFDLARYLRRIGVAADPRPDVPTLGVLHRAHLTGIPFENLDIQMGKTISLDANDLQEKMVRQRRGGYCFEQNTLLVHALRAVGFECHTCEARVRQNASGVLRARTHMVLKVVCAGRTWLADVGFGSDGIIDPVAIDGSSSEQYGRVYRIVNEDRTWVLQVERSGDWDDLYAILPVPVFPVDFVVANWFTSTHPESRFVETLMAQRTALDARYVLHNLVFSVHRGDQVERREISRAELVPLLHDVFAIDVPEDARFLALDGV